MDRLPDELRLLILSYLSPADLWLSVRHVNPQYQKLVDEVASKEHVPNFAIGQNFTLSSGSHHRWYDVRGTIQTRFKKFHNLNPRYALFELVEVWPKSSENRVLETWRRMHNSGFGPEQEWRVWFQGDGLLMRMPSLQMAESYGIWCEWREMLEEYITRWPQAWEGHIRPHER